MSKDRKRPTITLPVMTTEAHQGKTLEVDRENETISLIGSSGETLGTVTWASLIEHICASQAQEALRETRQHPRASLLSKVRYRTATGGAQTESRATGVGGGGLFIESTSPLAVGSEIELEFTLPDRSGDWFKARGSVAWVCPKPDQYTFAAGMGIRFSTIAEETRTRIMAFVNSLSRKDAAD